MKSIWLENAQSRQEEHSFPRLEGDLKTDVLIIGGGMAGILCAHELGRRGADCILVEGARIGLGTTGHTTGKITGQHGLIYAKILAEWGAYRAQAYFQASQNALLRYRELAQRYPCDFESKTAYVYDCNGLAGIEREIAAYQKLGISYTFREHAPIPVPISGALGMPDQAQFHPILLLRQLAGNLRVFENSPVRQIEGQRAECEFGSVRAEHIVLATHFPMKNISGLYFAKMYQHRSYAVALRGAADVDGMYVDRAENGFSFRNYKDYLFIGGGDHRTGKRGGGYEAVRALAGQAYPKGKEEFFWAAQDCMTLDAMPYIGRFSKGNPHILVATGFQKWGMTGSMAAATLLSDLIAHGKSEYEDLFFPGRKMPFAPLAKNALSAAGNLLWPGRRRCTHMGCALKWNGQERTWDCPCHGSRFDLRGHVLENPAKRNRRP